MFFFLENLLTSVLAQWYPTQRSNQTPPPRFPAHEPYYQLSAPYPVLTDSFGSALALNADGTCLAVGSYFESVNKNTEAGQVYLYYKTTDNQWSEPSVLHSSEIKEKEWFGKAVALSADGRTLAVGAPGSALQGKRQFAGTVTVFTRDSLGRWTQSTPTIASPDAAYFGTSLALSADGQTLLVGCLAFHSNDAAYLFKCLSLIHI